MGHPSRRQVVIVGSGITGLACAYHLKSLGIQDITVACRANRPPQTVLSPGFATGGQSDNFTRLSHGHGADFAQLLWSMGDDGFRHLAEFATQHGIHHALGKRLRLIVSEQERTEAEQAVRELQTFRPDVALRDPAKGMTSRVITVQDEGSSAGWFDTDQLLEQLLTQSGAAQVASVKSMETSNQGVELQLDDGTELAAEVVVLACHLQIKHFLPVLEEALVAVADQWCEWQGDPGPLTNFPLGTFWSANHTYEWGGRAASARTIIGGGRYLRPMAGIEATAATYEDKIAAHLAEQATKTFTNLPRPNFQPGHGELDCRPCDELPIIGPMFGEQRVLLATGYMGNGLTMGFIAGRCLAQLIATGKSSELPRRLWPERLRSMEVRR